MSVHSMIDPSAPPSASAFSETAMPNAPAHTAGKPSKSPRVNWHEAAVCALQIDLRDYDGLLEYMTEYVLGKNGLRIDLLIIKKLSDAVIPKDIARIFRTFNLFEIKGLGSSVTTDAYYKTIGYAGLLIGQSGAQNEYSALNVSLTFLSLRRPRKLIRHLTKERKITVAKAAPGVYHINKETFSAQIIVTKELSAEEFLYLRCLTDSLPETGLADRLAADCGLHRDQKVYIRYLHQLAHANAKTKGGSLMVCEGLLNLFGTSSEEIIERTRQEDSEYYLPKIEALTVQNDSLLSQNDDLMSQNDTLSARNAYLKSLLRENNIPFDSEAENTAD